MRKFKRRKAAAMMAAMILATTMAGSTTAFAATVNIEMADGAQISSTTVFSLYRILDVTTSAGSNGKVNYAYTLNTKYEAAVTAALGAVTDPDIPATELVEYLETLETIKDAAAIRKFAEAMRTAIGQDAALIADNTIGSDTSFRKSVPDGYYLITDNGQGYASSLCQLNTAAGTGELTLKVKGSYPEVEKKVREDDTYTEDWKNHGAGYNDVADYDIGENVPFSFYSKVPSMEGYTSYEMTFHDTMSGGLTFDPDSVIVKIANTELTKDVDYKVVTEGLTDNCTFEVQIADMVALLNGNGNLKAGDPIRLDFTAKLNENAVVGLDGNTNQVDLEYSSNPYDSADTKHTPQDKVIVFTYDLNVNKVDKADNTISLADAKFELYRTVTKNQDNTYTYGGKVNLAVSADPDDNTYVVDSTGNAEIVSAAGKPIVVHGLDSGTYYLKEIAAPNGYNMLTAPVEVTVTAAYIADRQAWDGQNASDALTSLAGTYKQLDLPGVPNTANVDANRGTISFNVENGAGTLLPTTGGTGTMLLYVAGTVLMAGGVFFLVSRRRKEEED